MNYLELPVYKHKDLILSALADNQVVVVESPTGSGKTTQMPVILHDAGYSKNGIIGVTQPRRIAAVSVSEFIARQLGTSIPGLVGYKMRFEDRTDQNTVIKIMTDGILLQEMKLDPWLSKYGCLVVDEAHERSLNIDFILGLLKRVLESRREFKVIVSSATINAQIFSEYFGECPVVKIDAITYPVTLVYDPPSGNASAEAGAGNAAAEMPAIPVNNSRTGRDRGGRGFSKPAGSAGRPSSGFAGRPDGTGGQAGGRRAGIAQSSSEDILLDKIVAITDRFINERREGDMLIFLSGEKMIKECMNRLSISPSGKYLHMVPLYGRLGKDEQERVFEAPPRGKTKVVIATNIAETSVTIDGITAVIDSGLSKLNYYNPHTFTSSLIEGPVSKASGNQRKGRAGRTREGTCYRLYARKDFENRSLFTTEEIYRTDLSEVVLRMADLGITAFEEFDFISPPNREGLIAAIDTLNLLDALESDHSLSKIGKMMTEFPLAPRQSRIIVEAVLRYPDVTQETIIAAAFLSTQNPYVLPPGEETDARKAHHSFRDPDGDFVSYLKLYRAYKDAKERGKFCEKNYLDEKTMAEIVNVTEQLEMIVSDMGVPILSGGSIEDYLCSVARGMIQFVCVRDGRELYRSLTADRILIHPGSVMFRLNPQYIVAGEIVKTSRMYAMSVSPLSHQTLEKISAELFEALGGRALKSGARSDFPKEKLKGARDFTNNIKIGDEVFEIETVKGKKTVRLPWERLSRVKDKIGSDTMFKGLKGVVTIDDRYTLLAGEKLALILSLAPSLDIEGALTRTWPRKKRFNSEQNLPALLEELPLILAPAPWGRQTKGTQLATKFPAQKKEMGFLCLLTDSKGYYWFTCSRGFHTSLNESLASLETLIDELGEEVDIEIKHQVNQIYRRLSDYL
ncbi:Pre-mRNA-splicing factor ATP-dependent RNA helicase PRP43 (Helicase JA1) [Treponema primitia ZAS-2]|uniref:Pre-mRNA-splicing factor ATP-dependent RNA helicase PRP43 (Helicase JA1) n=1 Tax=Treponema primitia (strain ATCC BAA-887 / DSM 12427 / ZAS-2) TaxID=545694 RepID=F5YIF0_TREPZ|nr:ATP-dependent RNA helicase [Treponema primitia]AEF84427.1 Pre-mRNA-splicing factor ATP-dependent RNA helicase PRP43 (Helicase JA1) [Treponema primitia ZAS-2]